MHKVRLNVDSVREQRCITYSPSLANDIKTCLTTRPTSRCLVDVGLTVRPNRDPTLRYRGVSHSLQMSITVKYLARTSPTQMTIFDGRATSDVMLRRHGLVWTKIGSEWAKKVIKFIVFDPFFSKFTQSFRMNPPKIIYYDLIIEGRGLFFILISWKRA